MKVAYLAPELPALSATFVYNEILQLEKLGTEVVPFSVHKPNSKVQEARVCDLEDRTVNLYAQAKLRVLKGHVLLFASHPVRYLKTLWLLCQDMCSVGFFTRTSFGLGYRFLFSASLATHLIKEECDHLHVHFAHIPTDIAMYASSLSSIPFSVTAHANDIFERGWLLKEKVDRSSFFAAISEFNKKYLADIGVKTDKVEIVRCGVDPDQFSPKKAVANNQVIKIGVIGRLVEKKGIDILIEAVTALKAQGKRIELHIAGSGPLEDSLKSLVRRNKLSEKEVVFFGAIPHAEVAGFIKSLDMFALPCRQGKNGDIDGIPVVLMEAMISGVPVITSNLSGIPELVIDQVTGLLHEENNIEALAEKISLLSEDTVLRQVLINEGSTKVKKDFSLIDNTKKLSFSSLLLLAYFLLVSSNSYAATIDYGFKKLAPNIESDLSGQLYVSATEGTNSSNTGIFFTFHNVVGIASSITQLVMGDDDNIFSTIDLFNSSPGVEFDKSDNLNGNNYGFTKTFSQSATGTNDGVDSASEWVTLFAIYNTAENFNSLLSAISNKKLHMGLHLQSIFPTDNSDRYVLSESPILGGFGNPVPLPAALWLFGPVLLGLMGFRKKAKV